MDKEIKTTDNRIATIDEVKQILNKMNKKYNKALQTLAESDCKDDREDREV